MRPVHVLGPAALRLLVDDFGIVFRFFGICIRHPLAGFGISSTLFRLGLRIGRVTRLIFAAFKYVDRLVSNDRRVF